ncbi:hypothetical protein QBC45DRAFT_449681 [Copromyces sp. CBS 386.78]|nr:hypothetical protein QBC45DRAFT_449681 [Copromyces sp. CBS 386.78]
MSMIQRSLSASKTDRIRLLQFPDDIINSFGITSSGPYGDEDGEAGTYQYELKGRSFGGHHFFTSHERKPKPSKPDASSATSWPFCIIAPGSSFRKGRAYLSSPFFLSSPPSSPVEWLAPGFLSDNRIRLVDDHIAMMRDVFQEWDNECYEFRLKHRPFIQYGVEGNKLRLLDGLGWNSYANICQNWGGDEWGMPDTWYFVKEKGVSV